MHVYTKQYTRGENTQDVYVENPDREKPRESLNSYYHYVKENIQRVESQRQRPRAIIWCWKADAKAWSKSQYDDRWSIIGYNERKVKMTDWDAQEEIWKTVKKWVERTNKENAERKC